MSYSGKIVAAHIRGQWDVALSVCPDQPGRHAQSPELRGAERLHDLRAGPTGAAAVQQAGYRPAARIVPVSAPPQHALASRFEQTGRAAWNRESKVQRILPRGD